MNKHAGLIGIILGIIGILLSIHFYIQSISTTSIALITDPVRTTLIESNSQVSKSKIKIFYDTANVTDDLHSIYFYLYNNGGEPIYKKQVRKPIILTLNNAKKIFETRIIKLSHPNTKLEIKPTSENSIQLDFDELYPNDGFSVQIIYEGTVGAELTNEATIVGMDRISSLPITDYSLSLFILITFIVVIGVLFLGLKLEGRRVAREDEYRMKAMQLKDEERVNQDISPPSGLKDLTFEKIMNIVAPIIMLGIIIGIFFLSKSLVLSWIVENPEFFIPEDLKIKIIT